MAASAIIALQTQAKTPIEEIQQRYWNVLKQVGRIWLEFILAYYVFDRPLYVTRNGKQEMRRFNGAKYQDIGFALSVDVGASSEFSEVLSQTTLDNFLANGYITVDQYIELASDNVVPFKERLRQMRAENAAQEQPVRGNPVVPERKKMLHRPAGTDGVLLPEIPAAQNTVRREEV
jgi:hypothetical protein